MCGKFTLPCAYQSTYPFLSWKMRYQVSFIISSFLYHRCPAQVHGTGKDYTSHVSRPLRPCHSSCSGKLRWKGMPNFPFNNIFLFVSSICHRLFSTILKCKEPVASIQIFLQWLPRQKRRHHRGHVLLVFGLT